MWNAILSRPFLSIVASIMVMILGVIALSTLPISLFPNAVPPQIQVSANYPGANAKTLEQSVAEALETSVTGVQDMQYMSSTSDNNGQYKLTIYFDIGSKPDTDQILTQMRANEASAQLPTQVNQQGITVMRESMFPLMVIALKSPDKRFDSLFMANYANIRLVNALKQLPGVGMVMAAGAGDYAMRVWLNPMRMAAFGLQPTDVMQKIQGQNTVNPVGTAGAEPNTPDTAFTYTMRTQGRLVTPDEFGKIVLKTLPDGATVRLADVARIELGAATYNSYSRNDGDPCAVLVIYQSPGSNALACAQNVIAEMEKAKEAFPPGMVYEQVFNTTQAVIDGTKEFASTLWQTLLLVIVVVFVFLNSWRATIIPILAIPVSLLGAFACFPLFGFSINSVSLMAIIMSIGLVVDDAIVVLEAAQRNLDAGYGRIQAAVNALSEVATSLLSVALVIAAVFLPNAFIGGITGVMYKQFAVPICTAILFSAITAMTLSPILCAFFLRKSKLPEQLPPVADLPSPQTSPEPSPTPASSQESAQTQSPAKPVKGPNFLSRAFASLLSRIENAYMRICKFHLNHWITGLLLLLAITLSDIKLFNSLPKSFVPEEDMGYLIVSVQLPPPASLDRTTEKTGEIERIIQGMDGVQTVTSIIGMNLVSGTSNSYSSAMFVLLKPWSERKADNLHSSAILRQIDARITRVPGAMAFAFGPPAIPGIGSTSGVSVALQDKSGQGQQYLSEQVSKFMQIARSSGKFATVNSNQVNGLAEWNVEPNWELISRQQIDIGDFNKNVESYMGGMFVNFFSRFGEQWQVYIQAEPEYRSKPDDILRYYIRNQLGQMVPVSTMATLNRTSGSNFLQRVNSFESIQLSLIPAEGVSSGEAMDDVVRIVKENLPGDIGVQFLGMSFEEQKAAEGAPAWLTLGLSALFVYLILCGLYASWMLPIAALWTVPVAILGAFLGLLAGNESFNLYSQVALTILIGLAGKNAVLIVQYAIDEMKRGLPPREAALNAARIRLRPILMTSTAFMMGCLPLLFASGAGATARQVMGWAVIGGRTVGLLVGVPLIPLGIVAICWLSRRKGAKAREQHPAPSGQTPPQPEAAPGPLS